MEALTYISHTQKWVSNIVIGLQLCPFASVPFQNDKIRYRVSIAQTLETLLADFLDELNSLQVTPDSEIETSLLIHPHALTDFKDYCGFVELAEELIFEADLEGIIQVASFHPDYQFAGTDPDDPANYSNRSPYPMLHFLREESVSRAVDSHPDPEGIPDRNVAYLRELGLQKLQGLRKQSLV